MGLTLTSQIKTALQKAKSYTASHISELAQATTELFEEVDAVKLDKPQAVAVSIPATGWQTDEAEDAAVLRHFGVRSDAGGHRRCAYRAWQPAGRHCLRPLRD